MFDSVLSNHRSILAPLSRVGHGGRLCPTNGGGVGLDHEPPSLVGRSQRREVETFCEVGRNLAGAENLPRGSTAKPASDLLRAGGVDARNGEEAGDDVDAAVPGPRGTGEASAEEGEGAGRRDLA